MRIFAACALALLGLAQVPAAQAASDAEKPFTVEFDVTLAPKENSKFRVRIEPSWAPLGAARFREIVDKKLFKSARFFRTISGFMTQFGIPGKPSVAAEWREKKLKDDPVVESNKRGYISFATSGKDSRTTQMFINLADNTNLDGMGFSPFGKVLGSGMTDAVDKIFSGYGEGAPSGQGPDQGRVQSEGNKYLKRSFPKLSYINSITVVEDDASGAKEEL